MPWVFLSLMLANAAYFGWMFVQEQPTALKQVEVGVRDAARGIVLLNERRAAAPAEVATSTATGQGQLDESGPDTASATSMPVSNCYDVGPFNSEVAAKKLGTLMKDRGFFSRIETRKVEERDFWVFVPPFTNRQKAEERLSELKKRGIDGFVVREGVFVNSISLNHFSKRELAQSFLQQMQSAGVAVEAREIKRSGVEFWVHLSESMSERGLRASVDEYLKGDEGLRREKALCEE